MNQKKMSEFFKGHMSSFFEAYKLLKSMGTDFKKNVIVSVPSGMLCPCNCGRSLLAFRAANEDELFRFASDIEGRASLMGVFERIKGGADVTWVHFLALENCTEAISCGIKLVDLEKKESTERTEGEKGAYYRVN